MPHFGRLDGGSLTAIPSQKVAEVVASQGQRQSWYAE